MCQQRLSGRVSLAPRRSRGEGEKVRGRCNRRAMLAKAAKGEVWPSRQGPYSRIALRPHRRAAAAAAASAAPGGEVSPARTYVREGGEHGTPAHSIITAVHVAEEMYDRPAKYVSRSRADREGECPCEIFARM